jgi:DNA primase
MTTTAQQSTDIVDVLTANGVDVRKIGDREITGCCPVHVFRTGRHDKSPSWSMNLSTGLWICFSCGARGTLSMLLSEISGDEVDTLSIQKMLVNVSMDRLLSGPTEKAEHQFVSDDFFNFVRVSDKRCDKRSLDPDLVYTYGVRWNPEHKSWAIPIMDQLGKLHGWQEKKLGYVRNFPVGVEKGKTLFGIERFRSRTAVLVESPLDVIRFAAVFSKPQAVASFGAYLTDTQTRLLSYVADKVIVALDNDKAGREASIKLYKSMPSPRHGVRWWNYSDTDAKDIGDMTDEEIERGCLTATVVPPWII